MNSVLEENAASASPGHGIDFEWEFYSPNKNIYEQCICCVSQLFHRRFNPGTLCIARSAVRTLRSVRKQTRVRFLNSCAEWGSLTIVIMHGIACLRCNDTHFDSVTVTYYWTLFLASYLLTLTAQINLPNTYSA